jgi:hypothetical protein
MTAALRLPDAFTPGRTSAAAATPTCCCCCCAISVVSASVALPAGFTQDVQERPPEPSFGRRTVAKVLLAILPSLLVALPFVFTGGPGEWLLGEGGLLAAGGTALLGAAVSAFGGSPTPWRASIRFTGWVLVAVAEFCLILVCLLGFPVLGIPAYLAGLVLVPMAVAKRYR